MIASKITRQDALQPVLVASHPRSGTHLLMDLLRRQFRSLYNWRFWGLPLDHLYLNLERLGAETRRFPEARALRIVNRPRRALMKTHFDSGFLAGWTRNETVPPSDAWLDVVRQARAFYIIRHPMDVMASYHQFLSAIDTEVAALDFMRFMRSHHWDGRVNRIEWWDRHANEWSARKGVTVLRYEDVVCHTADVLARVAGLIDESPVGKHPLLPPKVTSIGQSRLDRLFRLSPVSTAIVADRARFPAHDWRQSLGKSDMAWIEERIGLTMARFGYALDPARPVGSLHV